MLNQLSRKKAELKLANRTKKLEKSKTKPTRHPKARKLQNHQMVRK
jgi:hypothetical protein